MFLKAVSHTRKLCAEGSSRLCLELCQTHTLKSLYTGVGMQAVWKHQPTTSATTSWSPPPVPSTKPEPCPLQSALPHKATPRPLLPARTPHPGWRPLPPSHLLGQAGSPGVPLSGGGAFVHLPLQGTIPKLNHLRMADLWTCPEAASLSMGPRPEKYSGEDAKGGSTCPVEGTFVTCNPRTLELGF